MDDFRYHLPVPIERQVELARWSLGMLRILFISDVAIHARGDDQISSLDDLAEEAAAETGIVSLRKLAKWIKACAIPRIDAVLPHDRYRELARQLRAYPADDCRSDHTRQ